MNDHDRPKASIHGDSGEVKSILMGFRQALVANREATAEEFLANSSPGQRDSVLIALLQLEIDHRKRLGQRPSLQEFAVRFPNDLELLNRNLIPLIGSADKGTTVTILSKPTDVDITLAPTVAVKFTHGTFVGRYLLKRIAGVGSFGVVWEAEDPELHRVVALKMPRPDVQLTKEIQQQFVAEARNVARLTHPSIVAIYDAGTADGTCFIVSQFVSGMTLRNRIRQGTLATVDAIEIARKLADALHYAHQQQVVHRDIKPANVLLNEDGEPLITDFGLAKFELSDESLFKPGEIAGTPAYMSPEQALVGAHDVDARADIFSLGIVLSEMLTGIRPRVGSSAQAIRNYHQQTQELPLPSENSSDVPAELDEVFSRATSVDPDARYSTAEQMAQALAAIQEAYGRPVRKTQTGLISRRVLLVGAAMIGLGFLAANTFQNSPSTILPTNDGRVAVKLLTEPMGAEVTFIPLTSDTGFPRPAEAVKAESIDEPEESELVGILDRPNTHDIAAPGLSTGRMQKVASTRLSPGEYLVVTVWDKDSFHEVRRTVPAPDATSTSAPFFHMFWRRYVDGTVRLPNVRMVNRGEGNDAIPLVTMSETPVFQIHRPNVDIKCSVPRFRIAKRKMNWAALLTIYGEINQDGRLDVTPSRLIGMDRDATYLKRFQAGEVPLVYVSWNEAMQHAECSGFRLPNQLETQVAASQSLHSAEKDLTTDWNDGTSEWTINRGVSLPVSIEHDHLRGVVSSSMDRVHLRMKAKQSEGDRAVLPTEVMEAKTLDRRDNSDASIAVRFAKSARPRLTPKDFIQATEVVELSQKPK